MAFPLHLTLHPLMPAGSAFVPNREVVIGRVDADAPGRGHVEVFVPGYEQRTRELFERPLQVQGQTLQPWTPESIRYILQVGLPQQGLAGENRKESAEER